jgi:iron-sulfur cluster repair protein YtfE (RIC family)
MGLISEHMKKDHQRLSLLFNELRNSSGATRTKKCSDYSNDMHRHMNCEEEILFPLFEEKTGSRKLISSPTSVLRIAHEDIKSILKKIEKADSNVQEEEAKLLDILKEHEKVEISIVYPWLDEVIGAEAAKIIIDGMKKKQ